jgi:hypothetical protein
MEIRWDGHRRATPDAPHGAIGWPEDTDKEGKAWEAPINAAVRAALDRVLRERPGIGPAYLFRHRRTPLSRSGRISRGSGCSRRSGSPSCRSSRAAPGIPTAVSGPRRGNISRSRTSPPQAAGSAPRRSSAATSSRTSGLCLTSFSAGPSSGNGRHDARGRSWPTILAHTRKIGSPRSKRSRNAAGFYGVWRSPVARLLWEQEVPGSNPGAPTR